MRVFYGVPAQSLQNQEEEEEKEEEKEDKEEEEEVEDKGDKEEDEEDKKEEEQRLRTNQKRLNRCDNQISSSSMNWIWTRRRSKWRNY